MRVQFFRLLGPFLCSIVFVTCGRTSAPKGMDAPSEATTSKPVTKVDSSVPQNSRSDTQNSPRTPEGGNTAPRVQPNTNASGSGRPRETPFPESPSMPQAMATPFPEMVMTPVVETPKPLPPAGNRGSFPLPQGRPLRILPLGDSITLGAGSSDGNGYRFELWRLLKAKNLDVDFLGTLKRGTANFPDSEHEGHSGWRTDQILASVGGWSRASMPDVVFLKIGTNDINQNRGNGAAERVKRIIDEIHVVNSRALVLCALIAPFRASHARARDVPGFNAQLKTLLDAEIARGKPIALVDMYAALDARTDLADAVHPNDAGYSKMAKAWMARLTEIAGL